MVEDLLFLSRVGRKFTEIEKVDLNKLVDEIFANLEAAIKECNAKVVVEKLPTLYVHGIWKMQLFMILISSALKFNESKIPKIEILYEEQENVNLFKVRDNRIDIDEKYLERIFNFFERMPTEKKYDGTGAGLAIWKKIVSRFQGPTISAVAGNVKVLNWTNLVTKCQALEYIVNENTYRRVFDIFGIVPVVPGPFVSFRKRTLKDIGFYDRDTLTEDFDITVNLLKTQRVVQALSDANVYTDAPVTWKDFIK